MRKFVLCAVLITAFFIWLNRDDNSANRKAIPAATPTPSPRATSQHDWPKGAFDKTQAVIIQTQKDRAQGGQP